MAGASGQTNSFHGGWVKSRQWRHRSRSPEMIWVVRTGVRHEQEAFESGTRRLDKIADREMATPTIAQLQTVSRWPVRCMAWPKTSWRGEPQAAA